MGNSMEQQGNGPEVGPQTAAPDSRLNGFGGCIARAQNTQGTNGWPWGQGGGEGELVKSKYFPSWE